MKALDLYNRHFAPIEDGTVEEKAKATAAAFVDVLAEIEGMVKARGSDRDETVAAVLDEQERKWIAFAKLTDGYVDLDTFKRYLAAAMPKVAATWEVTKARMARTEVYRSGPGAPPWEKSMFRRGLSNAQKGGGDKK